ncbi:MAG: GNAT family N-acetyltransferase [Lentisphaeria bacterium]|nr:GNAT family N-acetyltransferase [Lentisphaeria bacterium]
MSDAVFITPAGVEDIPLICRTAGALWPQVYSEILSPEQISYMMDMMYSPDVIKQEMESGVFWITAGTEKKMAGYASFYQTEFDGKPVVKLDKIYLVDSFRGKGAGKKLLFHIIEEAKKLGVDKIILNVNKHNSPALAAYRSWGFTLAKSEVNDIGNGYVMDDHILALEI